MLYLDDLVWSGPQGGPEGHLQRVAARDWIKVIRHPYVYSDRLTSARIFRDANPATCGHFRPLDNQPGKASNDRTE